MDKVKVVVVDDSAFMRKLISEMIGSSEKFEVIAKLRNGKELIDRIDKYNPDIVTLDLEMPVLDGLATLKELKRIGRKLPVIVLSSLTSSGSSQTMECLEEGAIDFIEKPSGSISLDIDKIKDSLLDKMDVITSKNESVDQRISNNINTSKNQVIKQQVVSKKRVKISKNIQAVIIGASTGGPKALQKVLCSIESNIGVPIFVVQHMPKGFTKAFADRLNNICSLKVVEAEDGMEICKDTIYIAQGGYHMTVGSDGKIHLNKEPAIWGVRPAVDKLFESAVNVYKGNLLSVILTGMGKDGAMGTEMVKDAGGMTIAEDQSTCTIYGMPKAAYETGKVDEVLLLDEIGQRITNVTKGI